MWGGDGSALGNFLLSFENSSGNGDGDDPWRIGVDYSEQPSQFAESSYLNCSASKPQGILSQEQQLDQQQNQFLSASALLASSLSMDLSSGGLLSSSMRKSSWSCLNFEAIANGPVSSTTDEKDDAEMMADFADLSESDGGSVDGEESLSVGASRFELGIGVHSGRCSSGADGNGTGNQYGGRRKSGSGSGSGSGKMSLSLSSEDPAGSSSSSSVSGEKRSRGNNEEADADIRAKNREHAKNTRMRKKVLIEKLDVELRRLIEEQEHITKQRFDNLTRVVQISQERKQKLLDMFEQRSSGNLSTEKAEQIFDVDIELLLPLTPYRYFPLHEVSHCCYFSSVN